MIYWRRGVLRLQERWVFWRVTHWHCCAGTRKQQICTEDCFQRSPPPQHTPLCLYKSPLKQKNNTTSPRSEWGCARHAAKSFASMTSNLHSSLMNRIIISPILQSRKLNIREIGLQSLHSSFATCKESIPVYSEPQCKGNRVSRI